MSTWLMPLWQKGDGTPRKTEPRGTPPGLDAYFPPPSQRSVFGQIGPLIGFANVCPTPYRQGTHFLCYSDSGLHPTRHQRVRVQAAHRGSPTVKILETVTASTLPSIAGRSSPPLLGAFFVALTSESITISPTPPLNRRRNIFCLSPLKVSWRKSFTNGVNRSSPSRSTSSATFPGGACLPSTARPSSPTVSRRPSSTSNVSAAKGPSAESLTDHRAPPAQMASSYCMLSTPWRHSSPS